MTIDESVQLAHNFCPQRLETTWQTICPILIVWAALVAILIGSGCDLTTAHQSTKATSAHLHPGVWVYAYGQSPVFDDSRVSAGADGKTKR